MTTTHGNAMEAGDLPDVEKAFEAQQTQDGHSHLSFDRAAEKRVVRKIDLHLMPLVMILYLLAYLDRSNIG